MAMEIQQRDIQILKFVFACRVASYGQLINRFFAKNNESVAYRRIEALCDAGLLIPRVDLDFKKSIKFVSVAEKAWVVLVPLNLATASSQLTLLVAQNFSSVIGNLHQPASTVLVPLIR